MSIIQTSSEDQHDQFDFDPEHWLDTRVTGAGAVQPDARTKAWLLNGLGSTPACLQLVGGRLSLVGWDGPLFDFGLEEIESVDSPWWWFGGGIRIRVGGELFKVSFTRPNGAPELACLGGVEALGVWGGPVAARQVLVTGKVITNGRKRGAMWRAALAV